MSRLTQRMVAFAMALLLCLPSPATEPGVGDAIRTLAAAAASAAKSAPSGSGLVDGRGWLERFYGPRAYAPAWQNGDAGAAVALLQGAAAHGLAPSDYDADGLAARMGGAGAGAAALARFDVDLTAAMLHYLADLRLGRVRSEYHSALPDPRLAAFDPVEQLRAALDGGQLAAALDGAEPRIALYARVKRMLAHYRQLASAPEQPVPALAKGARLEPGAAYAHAAALGARLAVLGDLGAGAAPDGRYTPELAQAVRRFQGRHGLAEDGVPGPATLAALNVPLARRVRQLELTLERLRWLPDFAPGPLIAVNLPTFRLWAFQGGGASAAADEAAPLEMRVIVGAALKTPTPLFIGQMRYLEFNPYWNVPRSITRDEILPKLARNPAWLRQNGMEMVPAGRAGSPTSAVNADTLAALRAGSLRVRQRPGPRNALGAVKFAMPNPMSIYLHSTPARELFERSRRDLSHGCIRVEKPLELAQFVLGDQPQWDAQAIEAAMAPGPTRTVELTAPIPVLLFYATALPDSDGNALFALDVYRRDPLLEQALAAHRRGGAAAPVPARKKRVAAPVPAPDPDQG